MTIAPERPLIEPTQTSSPAMRVTVGVFIVLPFLAVLAAVPVAWGGWLGWSDVVLVVLFWLLTAGGITVGFHRYFTHGSFKTGRTLKIVLAVLGSMALEGSLAQWVADHRKHHKYSDHALDPHSPWRFGTSPRDVAKGLWWSHVGWIFEADQSPIDHYAPDIVADPDLQRVTRAFPWIVTASMLLPAVLGGLLTWSWQGAVTGFFWGSLFRIAFVHHVTWSINSVCHVWGDTPFESRDMSGNVGWLAIPALGESWHNLHHAEPTSARHGVLRGQFDASAEFIRGLEIVGLAWDVRWPRYERLVRKLRSPDDVVRLRGASHVQG